MKVDIVIPWRPQPERVPLFDHVTTRLGDLHPEWNIHTADSEAEEFNRAAARNQGVADVPDADVIVVMDADTVVDPDDLRAAVEMVASDGGIVMPWDRYCTLTPEGTEMMLEGVPPKECDPLWLKKVDSAGCIVLTPEAWWACGGMDERFKGWGGEDSAFLIAAKLLVGVKVLPGVMYAGSHPTTDKGGAPYRRNAQLYRRYSTCRNSVRPLMKLVNDPARWAVNGGPYVDQASPLASLSS